MMGHGSSVRIAIHYGLDGPGIESRFFGENFRVFPDRPWGPMCVRLKGRVIFITCCIAQQL